MTCNYLHAGTFNNRPYYRRADGVYYLWWDGGLSWIISAFLGPLGPPCFRRYDISIIGEYEPFYGASGIATVSEGAH